ncbi:MAG TPA: tripartite tricarboxylate transporter substrate binding protein [Burkholderiales bacterium]|nr:tripartite tricarboxylate transporter substrate binding protein [Burkholderiales bacterium]
MFLRASLLACALLAGAAHAQQYPARPIRWIVPFPPGGSTDTYSRIIGGKIGEALGQPVVFDNRAGAAGSVGAEIAAKAPPDGYTIVLGQDSNLVVGQAVRATKNFDTLRDFAPISLVVKTPQVIVVNDSSPFRTIKDLVTAAKAKPGTLNYASAGVAGSSHVLGTFFNIAAGIDTMHVPYKGGGPGMLDLRAGRVSYMVTSMVSSLGFARDGRARLLAITGTRRSHLFPDVPTLSEAGYPGFESTIWHGVLAPAKVPKPIVARINREVVKVLALPEVVKLIQHEGGTVSPSTPEEFQAFIRADVERWGNMVKKTGIRLD